MTLSKILIVALLITGFVNTQLLTADARDQNPLPDSHHSHPQDPETELTWKSKHLHATWFVETFQLPLEHEGVWADQVIVKADKNSHIEIDKITVKFFDENHDHPQKLHFYPYKRLHHGDRVRFKFRGIIQVVGVKTTVSGLSGSRSSDGFRVILKKKIHNPPVLQTAQFYGECIGGTKCPGYRRNHISKFTIDLKDIVDVKRIQFYAHDHVGRTGKAKINVLLDNRIVANGIDIKRKGAQHIIELNHTLGRFITFEAASFDEAVLQRISVDYIPHREIGGHPPRLRIDENRRRGHRFGEPYTP